MASLKLIFLIKRAVIISLVVYAFLFINSQFEIPVENDNILYNRLNINNSKIRIPSNRKTFLNDKSENNRGSGNLSQKYKMSFNYKGQNIVIDDVLTNKKYGSFEERTNLKVPNNNKKIIILSRISYITNEHLGGCRDWNCEITNDNNKQDIADGVIVSNLLDVQSITNKDTLITLLTQESPAHDTTGSMQGISLYPHSFISFRHDSYTSSPYGYTVHLAPESQLNKNPITEEELTNKKKTISWMVSHCQTPSNREGFVQVLQKYINVDIYGACGNKECRRENNCNDVDKEYYFYLAFENSICKDYITEKLWYRGFNNPIIPIVLKRSIVEEYVPPKSFIAVDDFDNAKELADYLNTLIKDKKKYLSYFEWMKEYKVIFLDGQKHDIAERPWGFCQFCKMIHEKKQNVSRMTNFTEWWNDSCEKNNELVKRHINI